MEAIFNTPEPGRTRLLQAWRRLREDDRQGLMASCVTDRALVLSREMKRREAQQAVRRCLGDVTAAAKSLGIDRTTIYRWLQEPNPCKAVAA